jgi:hypothetical protein
VAGATLEVGDGAPRGSAAAASAWASLLAVGGLLLVTGTLGFSVLQLRSYEDRIEALQREQAPPSPAVEAGRNGPQARPDAVVEAVQEAARLPAEQPPPLAGGAPPVDPRLAELATRIARLNEQLRAAGATVAARDAENSALRATNARLTSEKGRLTSENGRLTSENVRLTSENDCFRRLISGLTGENDRDRRENAALARRQIALLQRECLRNASDAH